MSVYNPFRSRAASLASVLIPLILDLDSLHAQGGSAVITLVMPVGARQLGMGEAAAATADDVYAAYWNPGGMAFGPVANEWQLMLPRGFRREGIDLNREFTALVTRPRSGFLLKSVIWAGAREGLLHFDGKHWREYHEYVMEQGDQVEAVVRRYAGTGDGIDSLVAKVKAYNKIRSAEEEEEIITLKLPFSLLFPNQTVTALALDNTDRLWVGTPVGLYRFDGGGWKSFDREEGFSYIPGTESAKSDTVKIDSTAIDTVKTDSLAAKTDSTGTGPEVAADTVIPKPVNPFRVLAIKALAVKGASIWIGTDQGLYEYKKGAMARRGENLLPSQRITAIGAHENTDEIYVGLENQGLARYRAPRATGAAAKWKIFNTADGLLDSNISHIALDKFGHAYAAHAGGVSHFSLKAWEKMRFPKQEVRGLALDEESRVWIATSEGAWKFTPPHATAKGRRAGQDPKADDKARSGDWIHFHSGNGLRDKSVTAVQTQGGDVWFLTGAGVERYNSAKSQVGFFYENLLPVLGLTDLYHAFMAASFPIEEWGTVGGFVNYVSFGQNIQSTADGSDQSKFDAYELVAGATYATRLSQNAGLGVNAKFIYSALSQNVTSSGEKTDGIAASYAVDLGFLQKNLLGATGLSLGFVLQNMGPAVFYVDQAQSDPIPFTWRLGLAYELIHTPNHRVTIAADANREAFSRSGDEADPVWVGAFKELAFPGGTGDDKGYSMSETWWENARRTVYNTGAEWAYANVVAGRVGYLHDVSGQRYEMDIGLGFMLSDILQIDGTFIKSFDNGIRNGQKRFSMILRF